MMKENQTQEKVETEERPAWTPKTKLGRMVLEGKIKSIEEILMKGWKIKEPEIVDYLIPNLKIETILIGKGGTKGGGKKRLPIKRSAKVTASGKRISYSVMVAIGNENGVIGIGRGKSKDARTAYLQAVRRAKLNLIYVKRGCGSWECGCGEPHSIPYRTEGKSGSVRYILYPAPKGTGLVVNEEAKKLLRLAGIKDVWSKTFGRTKQHMNLIQALFDALRNLHKYEKA